MSALTDDLQHAKWKEFLYKRACSRMHRWYGVDDSSNGMSCLYWMHAGVVTLNSHGIEAMPAAGSAHWQIHSGMYFGFEWGGDPEHALRREVILTGGKSPLPEMHCWIWIPKTQEVVDFSVGHAPALAKAMDFDWHTEFLPPQFYWARVQSLYPRAVYFPNRDATRLAIQTLIAGQKGTVQ